MSKEPTPTAQVGSAVKASPQLARLRVAETDETWISGEELYTDGSSDEDNCKCKNSPAKDSDKDSSATLTRLARSKRRFAERPSSQSSGESREVGRCGHESRSTDSLGASDEDESLDDDQISWKVNREEEVMMEEELLAIQKSRKEYSKKYDSVDSIFEQCCQRLLNLEQVDNEIFEDGKEKIKGDLMNGVQFLDTTLDKIMSKLEQIKKKTQQIQLQNRLRLKEIIKENPTSSAKLAENTKKFFDLYTGKGFFDTSDSCRTETSKDIVKPCVIKK